MEIKSVIDPENLTRDLEVNPSDLNAGFLNQAGLYAYYAARAVVAMKQEGNAKLFRDVTEAKVDKAIRDEATAAGQKLTEKQIEQAIARSPDYIKAERAHIEAKAMSKLADSAVEAFRQRRDMLIQLGANERGEMKGDLRMRSVEALRERTRDAA